MSFVAFRKGKDRFRMMAFNEPSPALAIVDYEIKFARLAHKLSIFAHRVFPLLFNEAVVPFAGDVQPC
jgi:hypothetical protein